MQRPDLSIPGLRRSGDWQGTAERATPTPRSESPAAGRAPFLRGPFSVSEAVDTANVRTMNQTRTFYTVVDRYEEPVHATGARPAAIALRDLLNVWHAQQAHDFVTDDARAREGRVVSHPPAK